ncbi:MAG: hypothetical protein AAGB04_20270 [Pseudomonadota bacterium]
MTKPITKIRDGMLTATVWKNDTKPNDKGEVGAFYSVDIKRSFKDKNEQWQETSSFTGAELLRVANLAQAAYNAILHIRKDDREASTAS